MDCEIAVNKILPSVRALMAVEMSKKLTQEEIAEILKTTQPAVSRYLKQSRGKMAEELLKKKSVRNLIKIASSHAVESGEFDFCSICKKIRKEIGEEKFYNL